jgi:subtilisin family serine protease
MKATKCGRLTAGRPLRAALLLASAAALLSLPAAAADDAAAAAAPAPVRVIVHLSETPAAMAGGGDRGTSRASEHVARVHAQHANVLKHAAHARVDFNVHHRFHKVFNGFSVMLTGDSAKRAADMETLRALPGVASVRPAQPIRRQDPSLYGPSVASAGTSRRRLLQTPSVEPPANFTIFRGITTRAVEVNRKLRLTGKGVRVAIIDSGIDYLHPDLGGGFGPGFKVEKGYDFVGDNATIPDTLDDFTATLFQLYPDDDPRDTCVGLGTSAAGMVAAKGNVVGMAPDATLLAYRIYTCFESSAATWDDLMIAAMERAYGDGADVMVVDVGSGPQYPDRGLGADVALVAGNLAKLGIITVQAGGNAGQGGMFQIENSHTTLLNTGQSSDSFAYTYTAIVNPGGFKVPYVLGIDAAPAPRPQISKFPVDKPLPLILTGVWQSSGGAITVQPDADACKNTTIPSTVEGNIAVTVRTRNCSINVQLGNVLKAGAAGLILLDNEPNGFRVTTKGPPFVNLTLATVPQDIGLKLVTRVLAGPAATITFNNDKLVRTSAPGAAGRLMFTTSSGPTATLSMAPDFVAPGNYPGFSTSLLSFGGYNYLPGAISSGPTVAGCVALLKQAKPGISLEEVRQRLQNTAVPQKDAYTWAPLGTPEADVLAPVPKQGAGAVDIFAAITSRQRASPSALPLGVANEAVTRKITIKNLDNRRTRFVLSFEATLAQPFPGPGGELVANPIVSFDRPSIRVPARSQASFSLTIAPPLKLDDQSTFSGFIVMTGEKGAAGTLRVPFYGWRGDYQKLSPIVDLTIGVSGPPPALADFNTTNSNVTDDTIATVGSWENTTFDMNSTFPLLALGLKIPLQRVTGVLTQVSTGLKLSFADIPYPYGPQNIPVPYFFTNTGYIPNNRVPGLSNINFRCVLEEGLYQVTLTILRPLGDASTAITIDGPSLRFRLTRPPGAGNTATFCKASGAPT